MELFTLDGFKYFYFKIISDSEELPSLLKIDSNYMLNEIKDYFDVNLRIYLYDVLDHNLHYDYERGKKFAFLAIENLILTKRKSLPNAFV